MPASEPHIAPHPPTARQLTAPLLASQFGQFFVSTPQDLIQDGLYKALALALYPPPFNKVSCCLVARALGAIDMRAKGRANMRTAKAVSAIRQKTSKLLPVRGVISADGVSTKSSTASGSQDSLQNVKVEGRSDASTV